MSRSSSPESVIPDYGDLTQFRTNGLHLELAPFGLENLRDYEAGGHHPLHLGDTLGDD